MAIICDTQIRELIGIEPYESNGKRPGRISFGVSSYGYDVRVGMLFKVFTNVAPNGLCPRRRAEPRPRGRPLSGRTGSRR